MTDGSGDAPASAMIATVLRDGRRDEVAVEEPLEIRVDGAPLACALLATTTNWLWASSTAKG